MYAIRTPEGLYRHRLDKAKATADLFDELLWYQHYLQATEACSGSHDVAVDAKVVAMEMLKIKDKRIKQLLQEVMDLQKKADPTLLDYSLGNFNHRHSVDSMEGIVKPEHHEEI